MVWPLLTGLFYHAQYFLHLVRIHGSLLLHLFHGLLLIINKQLRELLQIFPEQILEVFVVPALNAIVVLRKVELFCDRGISLHRLRQHSFYPLLDHGGFRGRVSSTVK